jgi:hypothetical protein
MDDDSTENARSTLAARNGNLCSNPDCRALLHVSQLALPNAAEVGVVVQIAGVDPRCDPGDGIWLCQNCASLVGNNPTQYPEVLLRAWKTVAEHHARFPTAKTASGTRTPSPVPPESESQLKTRAILPWKGKVVTLSQSLAGDTATGFGPTLAYSLAQVLDCTESHATVSRTGADGGASSIPLEDIELRIDATANQLELRVRCA